MSMFRSTSRGKTGVSSAPEKDDTTASKGARQKRIQVMELKAESHGAESHNGNIH